eukprot:92703_1
MGSNVTKIICICVPCLINVSLPQVCDEIELLEAFQCSNQSIERNIAANAYKSASGPNTNIHSNTSCECSGAFSCYDVSNISSSAIRCQGSNSCSNLNPQSGHITLTVPSKTWMRCRGSNSCTSSVIKTKSTDRALICSGFLSCASSRVVGFPRVEGTAAYSLYNSTIDSNGIPRMLVFLLGFYAGLYAQIICRSNSRCDIYRPDYYEPNALHIEFDCIGTCIFYVRGNYSVGSDISARINASYRILGDITIKNNDECNDKSISAAFDGLDTPFSETSIHNKSNICCRAMLSCTMKDIQTSAERQTVIASGLDSLLRSTLHGIDSLFCSGFESCFQVNIVTIRRNVYCLGYDSCRHITINDTQAEVIYCFGADSCGYSTIYTSGTGTNHYIYFIGHRSGQRATVHCKATDVCVVICAGDACDDVKLECDGVCEVHCNSLLGECPVVVSMEPTNHPTDTTVDASPSIIAPVPETVDSVTSTTTETVDSVPFTTTISAIFNDNVDGDDDPWLVALVVLAALCCICVVGVVVFCTKLYKPQKQLAIAARNMDKNKIDPRIPVIIPDVPVIDTASHSSQNGQLELYRNESLSIEKLYRNERNENETEGATTTRGMKTEGGTTTRGMETQGRTTTRGMNITPQVTKGIEVTKQTEKKGECDGFECSQCQTVMAGKIDDKDGLFYCFVCWIEYNASSTPDMS